MSDKYRIFKRYRLLSMLIIGLFFILTIKLASISIAQGNYYRDLSENKRKKKIYLTAPRGEIRDRNGILLAGNKPMFTVQIIKDEMKNIDSANKNDAMLKLINLLEEDAINFSHDFPVKLNNFEYVDNSDYFKTDITPQNRVIEIIDENNLYSEILKSWYGHKSKQNECVYIPIKNAINALEFSGKKIPIRAKVIDNELKIEFDANEDLNSWYQENKIPSGTPALESICILVKNDKTIMKKLLEHSIARGLTYDLLVKLNLQENIICQDITNIYREEFLNAKRAMMKIYPEITMETTAKQDFAILLEKNSLNNLLKYPVKDGAVNIAESIKKLFEEKEIKTGFEYLLKDEIPYYYSSENPEIDESVIIKNICDILIKNKLLDDLIDIPEVASIAQLQLLQDGISTKISITNGFEFVMLKNLKDFNELYKIDDKMSPSEAFNAIKKYYNIQEDISNYEAIGILNIYNELKKQGHLAYMPINFAYGLKNETVAKIEEQLSYFPAFNISIEPVRYYPFEKSAAHLLGYMGKISQSGEIEEYINKAGYPPDTLIGKTGIEESFQKNLYGKNGMRVIEVDSLGNTSAVLEETKPIPGDIVYLSLDMNLQTKMEEALEKTMRAIRTGATIYSPWGDFDVVTSKDKNRPYVNATSGAAIAVDIKTGEVLACASYPSYNPNLFAAGISSADWESLIPEDERDPLAPRPLYNVATQTAVQPGSTFKMITALAALEKGLDPHTKINDMGKIEVGDTTFACWLWNEQRKTHGYLDLMEAIQVSCNYYFYTLALGENLNTGEKLNVKVDINDISRMAQKFGLGSATGMEINVPREVETGVPNPKAKTELQKALLKNWLENNIEKYYFEKQDLSIEKKEELIDQIVSWADSDPLPTVKELYEKLSKLGIDGTIKVYENKKDTLVDLIKYTYFTQGKWTIADTLNITIGQGKNAYTLAQMVNYVSAICNGGYKNKLTLISNIKNHDNSNVEFQNSTTSEKIELHNRKNLEYVKDGMRRAALTGLNKNVFGNFPIKVAIKTGTAERSGINPITKDTYDSFAYEVGFAPYDDPKIAVATLIFQGGSGANCSPLMREIIAEYMGLYKEEEVNNLPIDYKLIP